MHPLDNPIWQSLTTTHERFAETRDSARRFIREVSVLAALSAPTPENYHSLASLLKPDERVGLFLQTAPAPPVSWTVVDTGPIFQMVCEKRVPPDPASNGTKLISLNNRDVPEMLALTKLTKPGPFNARTYEMGDYLGIRSAGTLAAMAGERLRLRSYTEVSAVCTHPDHLGHGYATVLMTTLMTRIHDRSEVPFLHVRPENVRAIQLYERLGFVKRASLHYAVIRKNP